MVDDHIVGLQDGTVRLVPHSAEWAVLFANERRRLMQILAPYWGDVIQDIQHVGSTSIPGIPAKPIIDIAVVVTDFAQAGPAIESIQELGYTYLGINEVPGRHFFYLGDAAATGRTHHLHMFEESSREWRQTAGFRDYLRAHPATADAYGALKLDLAGQFAEDRPAYLAGKADFIVQVLRLSVPERPMLWTTVVEHDTGLRFDYSQDVVDQPITLEHGQQGGSRRVQLLTVDARSLYFEITVYEDGRDLAESLYRLVDELRARYADLQTTPVHSCQIGGVPARQFAFAWNDTRREAIYLQDGNNVVRIIYDPRGPLNLAILETISFSTRPDVA